MNMSLDLAPLTTETGTSQETLVHRQSRPQKRCREKSPKGMNPRMRGTMKELKQLLAEVQKNERAKRTRGNVTKQGGGSKGNGDQAEGLRRLYLGD